jgi:uncharacterized membrane protein
MRPLDESHGAIDIIDSQMSENAQNPAESGPVFFDATLHPNRSLGPKGFRILMIVVGTSALVMGLLFVYAGAWPVFGFSGAEFLLLYLAFRLNYRAGRAYERVRLTDRELEIMRFDARGEVGRWAFEPTWLQISIDDPIRHDSQLKVSSHGRSLVIGRFLSPAERGEVADALRNAIAKWRDRWNPAVAG